MAWCEASDVEYVLGLSGNAVLSRLVEIAADNVRVCRAEARRRRCAGGGVGLIVKIPTIFFVISP
jgi:hypothetical protein